MKELTVEASQSYKVKIERGLLGRAGEQLRALFPEARFAISTDSKVEGLYLERLRKSLGEAAPAFVFSAGERQKNLASFGALLEFLARERLSRSDVLIALGGGVAGDLTGFAAACYLRGIRFVQIPTTLLAAVDSSVGGKTAVDLPEGKNLAGAFHQPSLVLIDPDCFSTLPREVFSQGVAECIKHGVLYDGALFSRLASGGFESDIEEIVERNVQLKAAAVKADEFDRGERQMLNLGHTFGHAVEKCSSFKLSHGEGVAIGMCMAARYSEAKGIAKEAVLEPIKAALRANGLPTECPFGAAELAQAAISDKKRAGGRVTLILIETIGHCLPLDIAAEELPAVMACALGKEI